ncbi:DASH complex subunit dad3 [Vanrija pseudolonga]|uniref:DASH complex subunit DAD3 n=1 Tax=Vanrija pseudolonga TaxID=143232 RepID=A0AAF0YD02_9TREE|nr:DASH complex subunit dad3 [Vanrija pseudolonga]
MSSAIESVNPYANNSQLSELESEVLWEYAKLGDKIRRITALAKDAAENPNEGLLADLRELEKSMKLVITLYRTSVWMIIQEQDLNNQQEWEAEESHERSEVPEHSVSRSFISDEGDSTVHY